MMNLTSYNPDNVQLPVGHLIGGELVLGDGTSYAVLRPSDGKLVREERGASAALVDRAVQAALKAYKTSGWAQAMPRERARALSRWAELVVKDAELLARLESITSPRLYTDALQRDVANAAELIRFAAEAADKIDGEVLQTERGAVSLVMHEPYGVIGGIVPWNAPMGLALSKMAPALVTGNACVLKPSEFTPYSLLRLGQLAIEAGIPAGLFAVVSGIGSETGHALVTHPDVAYVTFTGSTAAGARVMADAALSGCKPVGLELGGKSPQLVFPDAGDLDLLAEVIAGSCVRNAGQVCFSGSRLVVHRTLANPLIDRIRDRMRSLRPGPTWDVMTTLGPIISENQLRRIQEILQRAQASGAQVLEGGQRAGAYQDGFYFEPTVLLAPGADNAAVMEEFFGPVLTVQTFEDDDEGIALANHPVFGLAAGVHTHDLGRALRAARGIAAGSVWVNHYGLSGDYNSPLFAPHKQSGIGQEGGLPGITKFLRRKAIRIRHG